MFVFLLISVLFLLAFIGCDNGQKNSLVSGENNGENGGNQSAESEESKVVNSSSFNVEFEDIL